MIDSYHTATNRATEAGRLDRLQAVELRTVVHHVPADPAEEVVEIVLACLHFVIGFERIVSIRQINRILALDAELQLADLGDRVAQKVSRNQLFVVDEQALQQVVLVGQVDRQFESRFWLESKLVMVAGDPGRGLIISIHR